MGCKCEQLALYAKGDTIPDVNSCYTCKHSIPSGLTAYCDRFTSMVTGASETVSCSKARTDESLCGYYAKHWEEKNK